MNNQLVIDNDGHWEEVKPSKDKNRIDLEIGESIIGVFVSKVENTVYDGFIYTIQKDDGELYTMYSTTDLDRRLENVENGDKIKITRLEDIPMKAPKKPLQKYKVERWVKGESS